MLQVTLICTDQVCAREYEASTAAGGLAEPLTDLESLVCEACGGALQVIAISAGALSRRAA